MRARRCSAYDALRSSFWYAESRSRFGSSIEFPKNPSLRNVLASRLPAKYPENVTCPGPRVTLTITDPECGGRRNGRWPTRGEKAPIGMPGNFGLVEDVALNAFVTVAS